MVLAGFIAADVFAGLMEGVRRVWSFLNSDQGLMVEGFVLALAALHQLHRGAAADLLRTHGKKKLVDILTKVEAKLKTMQGERDEARAELGLVMAALEAARPDHEALNDARARLARMEAIWLDAKASEEDCRAVLEANQWVLLPDYVVDPKGLLREVSLATVLSSDFPESTDRSAEFRTPVNPKWTADLAGWASAESGFEVDRAASTGPNPRRLYLIIAVRSPGDIVDRIEIEHAHAYAHALMLMTPDTLWGQRIDCLVIGGAVATDLKGADLRWGPTAHAAIRIIPVTYRQLLARARQFAATFLPALPESALDIEPAPIEPLSDEAPTAVVQAVANEPATEAPVLETVGLEVAPASEGTPAPVVEPQSAPPPTERRDLHEAQQRLRGLLDRFHGREPG